MTRRVAALRLCDSLTRELEPQYRGQVGAAVIAGFVDVALKDLRGSVAAEALPEMAARLAKVRIDRFRRTAAAMAV